MLRLYPSNKTESLAAMLAAIIRHDPIDDPFEPEHILIQSQGMGAWLQQQVSSQLGVAALIETQMPAAFVWKLAQTLLPDAGVSPLFDKHVLRWEIFRQLPELLTKTEFRELARYLDQLARARESQPQQLLYFQIADALADAFDGYQNYRADWIESWEQGNRAMEQVPEHIAALEAWQEALWQALYPELAKQERLHRPRQIAALKNLLQRGDFDRARLPKRLFVFGLSALPPQWLEIFILLARYVPIHFLIQNPCRYYWGDVQSPTQVLRFQAALAEKQFENSLDSAMFIESNPMLASWGKLGRDYLGTLYQYDETQGLSEFAPAFDSWGQDSALKQLQEDVLELRTERHALAPDDASIRFASCHSRLREVEALKDYLLTLFDQNPELAAKDVLVMMPDVQLYAPLLDAVFARPVKNQLGGDVYLRYAISDQSLSFDQNLIETFLQVLKLPEARLTALQVMDWLDIEALRSRFGIDASELDILHAWVERLNVRWGLSGAHRQHVSQSQAGVFSERSTWLQGMRRLLAGYVFGSGEIVELMDQAVLPVNLSSRDAQHLLGRFMRLLDTVDASIKLMSGELPALDWLDRIYQVWRTWFDAEIVPEALRYGVDQALQHLREQFSHVEIGQPLAASVVVEALNQSLGQERVSQRFLAGRINFCTLMPMRSIPFRVVCLLGMNEGEYPRPTRPSSFDLMSLTDRRIGDRSRREDDRYLFLEALMSVRERLYISYCGRNAQDNSERFPSTLVSELRDYLGTYFYLSESQDMSTEAAASHVLAHLTTEHRLQSFHPQYYQTGPYQSFMQEWAPLYENSVGRELENEEVGLALGDVLSETQHLSLAVLMRALSYPLRWYYQQLLGVSAPSVQAPLEEAETFALDALAMHRLKQELLLAWQASSDPEQTQQAMAQVAKRWELESRLPEAPLAQFEFEQARAALEPIQAQLSSVGRLRTQDLVVMLDERLIKATVFLCDEGLVDLVAGKGLGGRFWAVWVQHVFWNLYWHQQSDLDQAPCAEPRSVFFSAESKMTLPFLGPQQAQDFAAQIVQCFDSLHEEPAAFLPRTAFAMLFQSESKAKQAYFGSSNQYGEVFEGESDDFYWQRGLKHRLCEELNFEDLPAMFEQFCLYEQVLSVQSEIVESKQ